MKINTDKFLKTSPLIKPTQTKLKAPFAWVGGKNYLAKEIIALMPEHKSYIEVFGGALSVFYQKSASKILTTLTTSLLIYIFALEINPKV